MKSRDEQSLAAFTVESLAEAYLQLPKEDRQIDTLAVALRLPDTKETITKLTDLLDQHDDALWDKITKYQVAVEYFDLPLADRKLERLAEALRFCFPNDKVTQNRLGRMLRAHEEDNLVLHQVLASETEAASRNFGLERMIKDKFHLREAVIANLPAVPTATFADEAGDDTALHESLARFAAPLVASLIRPNDIIGVGGGRAPRFTGDQLKHVVKQSVPNTVVTPLTGALFPTDWRPHTHRMNATQVAQTFASMFGGESEFRGESLAPRNETSASDGEHAKARNNLHTEKEEHSIGKPSAFLKRDVTVAVIGVGCMTSKHPMLEEGNPHVAGIKDALEKLKPIISRKPLQVCDVCNFLLFTGSKDDEEGPEIETLLDTINCRTNTVNAPVDIPQIVSRGVVVLIAGGPQKIDGIRYALSKPRAAKYAAPWVSHLVTDSHTAKSLLE